MQGPWAHSTFNVSHRHLRYPDENDSHHSKLGFYRSFMLCKKFHYRNITTQVEYRILRSYYSTPFYVTLPRTTCGAGKVALSRCYSAVACSSLCNHCSLDRLQPMSSDWRVVFHISPDAQLLLWILLSCPSGCHLQDFVTPIIHMSCPSPGLAASNLRPEWGTSGRVHEMTAEGKLGATGSIQVAPMSF